MVDQVQGVLLDLAQMCIGPGPRCVLNLAQMCCWTWSRVFLDLVQRCWRHARYPVLFVRHSSCWANLSALILLPPLWAEGASAEEVCFKKAFCFKKADGVKYLGDRALKKGGKVVGEYAGMFSDG